MSSTEPQEPREDPVDAEEIEDEEDGSSASESHHDSSEQSDADEAGSDDGSEASSVEWLASGRERRSTAGRNMKNLLAAQEEDEELDLLFAEAEEEDVDFQSSDVDAAEPGEEGGGDSSSSSDEDDKPVDELEGEKELQKEERAERRANKRKTVFRLPPARKRAKVDQSSPSSQTDSVDQTVKQRPRKKSERLSWVPSGSDAPLRASTRTLSMQHKKATIANLKEAEARRRRQLKVLEEANKRKEQRKRKPMTQAERLAEAAETERLNSKSLHRWEEMENERLRKQQARLAAMQNRTIEGPFIRYYSGPAEWVDGQLKRIGNPSKPQEIEIISDSKPAPKKRGGPRKPKDPAAIIKKEEDTGTPIETIPTAPGKVSSGTETASNPQTDAVNGIPATSTPDVEAVVQSNETQVAGQNTSSSQIASTSDVIMSEPSQEPKSTGFLDGIDYYASLSNEAEQPSSSETPQTAQAHGASNNDITISEAQDKPNKLAQKPLEQQEPSSQPESYQTGPPPALDTEPTVDPTPQNEILETENAAAQNLPSSTPQAPAPPETPKPPPVIEHSAFQALSLHNFSSTLPSGPAIINRVMLGFNPSTNGTSTNSKTNQALCAVTNQPARYRDPFTGIPYRGVEEFRIIRRLAESNGVAGMDKPAWSSLLNAFVGKGLPANGVPDCFMTGKVKEVPPQQAQVPEVGGVKAEAAA